MEAGFESPANLQMLSRASGLPAESVAEIARGIRLRQPRATVGQLNRLFLSTMTPRPQRPNPVAHLTLRGGAPAQFAKFDGGPSSLELLPRTDDGRRDSVVYRSRPYAGVRDHMQQERTWGVFPVNQDLTKWREGGRNAAHEGALGLHQEFESQVRREKGAAGRPPHRHHPPQRWRIGGDDLVSAEPFG